LPASALKEYRYARGYILEKRTNRSLILHLNQVSTESENVQQTMNANLADAIRMMGRWVEPELKDIWLTCVAQMSDERIVLLCDNYDVFQERVGREDAQNFWDVLDAAAARLPGLRVVVAGRESVYHCNEIRVLESGLANEPLDSLSPIDSEKLLRDNLGVTDPAFCEAVYTRLVVQQTSIVG